VVEQGKAAKKGTEEWTFKSTRSIENTKSCSVLLRARDRTGNHTDGKFSLDNKNQV
jgi:hypothetical protein